MSASSSDWDELRCPLPVVRLTWDEDGSDESHTHLAVCGEPLYVSYARDEVVQRVGEQDTCGTSWKVGCLNDHVLLRPDYQADDNFGSIPFDRTLLDQVLAQFGGESR